MRIASLTLREYQWGSRSINFTLFRSGLCPVLLACSETEFLYQVPLRECSSMIVSYELGYISSRG